MDLIALAERGVIPDAFVRVGIRSLLKRRMTSLKDRDSMDRDMDLERFVEQLRDSPLAIATEAANDQHYEVPAEFFATVLGPRMKYSSCYFERSNNSLAEAEENMLRITCERAEIHNGMRLLELGCGWGSLTLWMADHYKDCEITAVSNSTSQRAFIEQRARQRRLGNVRVITADMRDFQTDQNFDRVISVEMFEHMRNYELLLRRVASWLTAGGKAFVHVFCHRDAPYLFETDGAANWMGRNFFTGGMMPSENLFRYFQDDLSIETQWPVNGLHYWKTCELWLQNLDKNRKRILKRFREDLSSGDASRNLQRWRMFFMACAELFRFRDGNEWFVAQYLFVNKAAAEAGNSLEAVPKVFTGVLDLE